MEVISGVLSDGEVAMASRLLARAFAEDPIITHYLSDPVRRIVAFPAFFEAVLVQLLPSTQVFAARSRADLVGVAAWLPPDPVEPDDAFRARASRRRAGGANAVPASSGLLYEGFAALEGFHPDAPHWYLAFVGIEAPAPPGKASLFAKKPAAGAASEAPISRLSGDLGKPEGGPPTENLMSDGGFAAGSGHSVAVSPIRPLSHLSSGGDSIHSDGLAARCPLSP